ncbi:gamma-glutamyltransferase [Umboniibacter marinipuniceus]|uniref:Glutathione hydrolase proenzyme n=1 Tax=Umboniibacter marinipuniceus TaxID=569599 RepID=A0A3M0A5A9_9GAMM|nr:gamma-glutamyltransferase [Umboniibacter marinipuniceus]RMA77655.1 gamma-glutamyltranspeptidase/glutathione hydrolase [Umboniibacter marinipuniceus]
MSVSIKQKLVGVALAFVALSFANSSVAGAVAMPEKHAAAVAKEVIESGGNAVDAAVAAGFVLSVTYPEAGNIGGGGFMLLHMDGVNDFLDYRETAPADASRDMYLNASGEVIPNASLTGGASSGTPGTVAGLWAAHQKYGSKPWRDLVMPAVRLAREGFIVEAHLEQEASYFMETAMGRDSNFYDYFGAQLITGERFKQPSLAETLQRIADQGPDGFYKGKTAELIVAQMARTGGLVSKLDLANYHVKWRTPLVGEWQGTQVVTAPPPSSGGIALLQILGMYAQVNNSPSHNSADYVHQLAEIYKRVYADRAEYLGDPDFVSVPQQALLADEYIKARASEVNHSAISETADISYGSLESPQTTHFSIVDNAGNAVSNTYTLNWSFGSGNVVEGAGFLLNNEMDDFSAKPGVPNIYGVIGGEANAIEPNKRMLSSMTPSLVLVEGKVDFVSGTPGGSTIITSVAQTILNRYVFGQNAEESVSSSRFHHQLFPKNHLLMSEALSEEAMSYLAELGYSHSVEWLGDLQVVAREGDTYHAAADPRGRGIALSF